VWGLGGSTTPTPTTWRCKACVGATTTTTTTPSMASKPQLAQRPESSYGGFEETTDDVAFPRPPPDEEEEGGAARTAAGVLYKAQAIYDYAGEQADELTFEENDVIMIVKENDDGWCQGYILSTDGLKRAAGHVPRQLH